MNGQLESLVLNSTHSIIVNNSLIAYLDAKLVRLKHLELHRVIIDIPILDTPKVRFQNLKKLVLCIPSTTDAVRDGFLPYFGEGIEDLELYNFRPGITDFVKSIERFKNLKQLTLHMDHVLDTDVRTALNCADSLVWSPTGICRLTMLGGQLNQIIFRRCNKACESLSMNGCNDKQYNYFDDINDTLEPQWNARFTECFDF